MTQAATAEAAIDRFKENEERLDIFVNDPADVGYYQSNETPPSNVKTLPRFIIDAQGQIDARFPAGFNNRGAFASATAYVLNDVVTYGGFAYLCISAYTSSATTPNNDRAHWIVWQGLLVSQLYPTAEGGTDTRGVDVSFHTNKGAVRIGGSDITPTNDERNFWRGLPDANLSNAWGDEDLIGLYSTAWNRNGVAFATYSNTFGHDCVTYGVASVAGGAGSATGDPDAPTSPAFEGYCAFSWGKNVNAKGTKSAAFNEEGEANGRAAFTSGYGCKTGPGDAAHPNEDGGSGVADDGIGAKAGGYKAYAYGKGSHAQGANLRAYNGAHVYGSGINDGTPLVNSLPRSIAFGSNVDVPTVILDKGPGTAGGFGKVGLNTKKPRERVEAVLKSGDKIDIRIGEVAGDANARIRLCGTKNDGSTLPIFEIGFTSPNGGQSAGTVSLYMNGNSTPFLTADADGNVATTGAIGAGGAGFKVNGTTVIGGQQAALVNPDGTLSNATYVLTQVLNALRAHGLIAT